MVAVRYHWISQSTWQRLIVIVFIQKHTLTLFVLKMCPEKDLFHSIKNHFCGVHLWLLIVFDDRHTSVSTDNRRELCPLVNKRLQSMIFDPIRVTSQSSVSYTLMMKFWNWVTVESMTKLSHNSSKYNHYDAKWSWSRASHLWFQRKKKKMTFKSITNFCN